MNERPPALRRLNSEASCSDGGREALPLAPRECMSCFDHLSI